MHSEKCLSSIWENLINGNITDAKKAAARVSGASLEQWALDNLAWRHLRILRAVSFLKGYGNFKDYCDACNG